MEFSIAKKEHTEQIYQLVQNTIQSIYPKYYPREVVALFSDLHSRERIAANIENDFVRVLFADGDLVGTGSYMGNHISRLFVLPDLQGKGYGSYMMQRLEKEISEKYNSVVLDASLAATCFYEHKGYQTIRHEELSADNGAVLVYGIMEKQLESCKDTITRLEHIAMYVNDLDGAKEFFEKYFGAVSNQGYHNVNTDFFSYFLTFGDGTRLEIMNRPSMTDDGKGLYRTGYIHIAFSVGSKEKVDNLTEQLRSDGYEIISGPRTTGDGYYESCIVGIEGNQIEITV